MLTVIIPRICRHSENYRKIISNLSPLLFVNKIIVSSTTLISKKYDQDQVISDKVEYVESLESNYSNALVKNAARTVTTEFMCVIPDTFILEAYQLEFIFENLKKHPDCALMLGRELNVINEKSKERYCPYLVYDHEPTKNDFEYCVFHKTSGGTIYEELKGIEDLSSHYVLKYICHEFRAMGMPYIYVANERLRYDDSFLDDFSSSDKKDHEYAADLKLERKPPKSVLKRLFSFSYENGSHYLDILYMTFKFRMKHRPVFSDDCHSYTHIKKNCTFERKRACIFAGFTRHGIVTENTIIYLKALKEHVDYLVYAADSKATDESISLIEQYADAVIINRHNENYFGSYKRGYALLKELNYLDLISQLLFVSDEADFAGTSSDLANIIRMSSSYDIYSLCMATYGIVLRGSNRYVRCRAPYPESYFMVTNDKFFRSQSFENFLSSVHEQKTKIEYKRVYEMSLGKLVATAGFCMGSYYPFDETNTVDPYLIYVGAGRPHPILVKPVFMSNNTPRYIVEAELAKE